MLVGDCSRHEVENSDFIKFVAIEDTLNEYRSSLEGMSRVITQLMENRRHLFKTRDLEALEDVDLHIRQVLVAISSSTHTISSIQNAYSTVANNTLNQRMKALTAITILLAIPNVFLRDVWNEYRVAISGRALGISSYH